MRDVTRRAWTGLPQLCAVLLVCLFLPAWTVRYWQAWVFLALFVGSAAAITRYLLRYDLALLQRRLAAGPGAEKERRQQIIQGVAAVAFLGTMVVPGSITVSSGRRFRWRW